MCEVRRQRRSIGRQGRANGCGSSCDRRLGSRGRLPYIAPAHDVASAVFRRDASTPEVTFVGRRRPPARPAAGAYSRKLPHLQVPGGMLFITFVTWNRRILPEAVRQLVLDCCLHDHGSKYALQAAVVMPDHVHLLLTPNTDDEGNTYSLREITASRGPPHTPSIACSIVAAASGGQSRSTDSSAPTRAPVRKPTTSSTIRCGPGLRPKPQTTRGAGRAWPEAAPPPTISA